MPDRASLVLGIDAGGTSTRARAVAGGEVVHDGSGGPGNPLAASREQLAQAYAEALAGCPSPTALVAGAAGAGADEGCRRVAAVLRKRFPDTPVRVVPDYAIAWTAAGPEMDVVTIAGTGSVVCSRDTAGRFAVSGGVGWILGDPGSGARLGRAFLERWCALEEPDPALADAVRSRCGSADPRALALGVHASPAPAALLARAAPLLSEAAERGEAWAQEALARELGALAAQTAAHVVSHGARADGRVALVGGVWRSAPARAAFERALAQRAPALRVVACRTPPIEGALQLARELAEESG